MRDGVIVTAAPEERFCRKKNYVGYPKQAIDYCLQKENTNGEHLNRVAYTTCSSPPIIIKAKTTTQFSLRDYMDYYGEKYYGRKLKGENVSEYLRWLNTDKKI